MTKMYHYNGTRFKKDFSTRNSQKMKLGTHEEKDKTLHLADNNNNNNNTTNTK